MTADCSICQHAKIEGINEGLKAQLPFAVIAARFHVPMKLIALHRSHFIPMTMGISGIDGVVPSDEATMASCERCEARPSIRFKRAWRDARNEHDTQELARMIAWLQEQL